MKIFVAHIFNVCLVWIPMHMCAVIGNGRGSKAVINSDICVVHKLMETITELWTLSTIVPAVTALLFMFIPVLIKLIFFYYQIRLCRLHDTLYT